MYCDKSLNISTMIIRFEFTLYLINLKWEIFVVRKEFVWMLNKVLEISVVINILLIKIDTVIWFSDDKFLRLYIMFYIRK